MNRQEFQSLLKRYREGLCSAEERRIIESFDQNLLRNDNTVLDDLASRQLEEEYLLFVNNRLQSEERKVTSSFKWAPYVYGIAASVVILFVVSIYFVVRSPMTSTTDFLLSDDFRVISNDKATAFTVTLSDSSKITLEPGATLKYKEQFSSEIREVQLKGVAFFDISRDPNRPFVVYTRDVVTRVLGTSFTIRALENERNVTVSVKTGRVSVMALTGDKSQGSETILTANHRAIVDLEEKTVMATLVEVPQHVISSDEIKRMRFDNASVSDVFLALEKMYGIDILFDDNTFSACKIRTSISDGEMFNRLDIICNAIGATYTVEGTYVAIHGSGCN